MNKIIAKILIVMGILALSLLSSCPGAGAGGTNPGAGDTNPGEGDTNPGEGDTEFVRRAATVTSTTPAWSSDSSTETATTTNAANLRAAISGNGPYTLTVPAGVTSIHAVVVGGGGAAFILGGGAGYIRAGAFTVEAGEELTLTVGAGGRPANTDQDYADGKASSIKSGDVTIMEAQGGKGFVYNNNNLDRRFAGAGSGGGGAIGANGGYCADGGNDIGGRATKGGKGGNGANYSSGSFGGPAAECTDEKSDVKYGAGGGGAFFPDDGVGGTGGLGGTATAAGTSGTSGGRPGTWGANHYGSGGGGGARHATDGTGQGGGGTGVIVLYVD